MVRAPRPAPISSTISCDDIFARLTIISAVEGSTKKCCPNCFFALIFQALRRVFGDVISSEVQRFKVQPPARRGFKGSEVPDKITLTSEP